MVPEECGSAAELQTELRKRVGARADAVLDETRLSIFRDGEQYRLSMKVGAEARAFRDPNCRHLFDAAVVVAASLAEGPAPRPAEAPSAPTDAPAGRGPERARDEAPEDTKGRRAHSPVLGVGVGVGTNFGFLPKP